MTYLFTNNQEIKNDVGNPIPVVFPSATATTAFGEPVAVQINPIIQLDAIYGLDPDKITQYTDGSGTITNGQSRWILSTGTDQYAYATFQTSRAVRYRAGQGALARFTAAFINPSAGYTQRAGFGTLENALQVGYDGTQFGVLRASGGAAEIWHLTITNPASGPETVTITLNGVAFNIPVTASNASTNATTIGMFVFNGWNVDSHSAEVHFQAQSLGAKNGTFSISSTGTLTGTLVRVQLGVTQTENWTPQSSFNIDTLNGNGPSGMTIDPSKLNVYQVSYRWLGVGMISYAIEDEETGRLIMFHQEHYTNKHTIPHLSNPTMRIQYVAASLGGVGQNVQTIGASAMGAIEGNINVTSLPNSYGSSKSSLTQNTYAHLLSIRNHQVFQDRVNQREIILKRISAAATSAGSAPMRVLLYKTVTCTTPRSWVSVGVGSTALYSSQTTTVNHLDDRVIYEFVIMPGAAESIDLSDLRIVLSPGDSCAVAIYGTGTIQNASAALAWVED